ncbi:spore coat protein GerQ [Filobacillus milosensis]|uniref:Spore coat protein GerQ n=2 Tax=Filobacillus milosensis TaxID=94137 RepID=A0A4Y8IFN7_9BACI|nr:spore coat protein GerQ [Filobacillus milosensis]
MMQGGGSGMGGQQGGMMPGMVQGMQGGMMPGMQQGGQGMMGGQQGGPMQGMMPNMGPMQQGQGPYQGGMQGGQGQVQGQQVQIPIGGGGPIGREQSYIENILRLNTGKPVKVYMTFEGQKQQIFEGILREAGKDHIVVSDPESGNWYLLLMIYLDYVVFDEEINYQYPFG